MDVLCRPDVKIEGFGSRLLNSHKNFYLLFSQYFITHHHGKLKTFFKTLLLHIMST
jgi:hypothetical protein